MHRRLLYYSYNKLIIIAKEIGIIYTLAKYTNFDYNTYYALKAKAKISRNKVVPI